MSAADNISQPQFFHGTRSEPKPGEMLTAEQAAEHANFAETDHDYIHVTDSPAKARKFAEIADVFQAQRRGARDTRPKVYQVEPTGPVEHDEFDDEWTVAVSATIEIDTLEGVATTMPEALDRAWKAIRKDHPRVPVVTVEVTRGRGTSCATMTAGSSVVLVSAKMISEASPRDLLGFLLHHAAHGLLAEEKVPSEGRYHSRAYRDAARGLGLVVGNRVTEGSWSKTYTIGDDIAREYSGVISQLGSAQGEFDLGQVSQGHRNLLRLHCQCDPPRVARASRQTLDQGPITCEICRAPFTE